MLIIYKWVSIDSSVNTLQSVYLGDGLGLYIKASRGEG